MPGDCLWKLAGLPWVYNNPLMWPKLYEANKDQIKDPDLIYPGQKLRVER
ncbi:MAG: LysM peptidoglycan-binding domain-containing protein [Candidatus Hydrothermae bacterium]|nr:LysM peptidoglycan-binding domain-containing protein [Candidatus Hydrothermae bacterium]